MGRQARAPGRAIRRNGTEQHPSELGYGRRRIRATRGDAVDHSRLRGIRPVREHERSSLRPRRGRRRRVVVSRLRGHERGLAETGLERCEGLRHVVRARAVLAHQPQRDARDARGLNASKGREQLLHDRLAQMSVRLDHFPHEEHHVDGGGLVRVPKKVHERGDNGGGRIWKFDRRGMDGRDEHSTILWGRGGRGVGARREQLVLPACSCAVSLAATPPASRRRPAAAHIPATPPGSPPSLRLRMRKTLTSAFFSPSSPCVFCTSFLSTCITSALFFGTMRSKQMSSVFFRMSRFAEAAGGYTTLRCKAMCAQRGFDIAANARTECTHNVHDHLLKDLRVLLLELLRRGGTRGIPFCWERRATHGRREPAGHGVSRSREHGCLQSFEHDEFDVVVTLCREELSVRGRSGADRGGRRRERDECRSTLVPVERSCVKEEADGEYTRPGDTHTTAFDCALKRVRIQRIYFDFSNGFARTTFRMSSRTTS